MSANAKLKFLLVGNLISKNELGEYPQRSSEKFVEEGKQIFNQLCQTDYNKFLERQKIDSINGHFFFTSYLNGIFYLAFADLDYEDRYAFELFEKLQGEALNIYINEKGKMNETAMEKLKSFFKKYEDPRNVNNVMQANLEIEGVRLEMGKNIKNMVNNVADLKDLDGKSQKLKEGSEMFSKDARELESVTFWKNCKLTIIIIVIVVAIILCIAIPLAVRGSGNSNNNNQSNTGTPVNPTNSTNTTKMMF